jgi:hypothetical protein
MRRPELRETLAGGFVGTALMVAFTYLVAPVLTEHPMDVAATLAGALGTSWTAGMLVHLAIGIIILPIIYLTLYPVLAGPPWLRGVTWGVVLWVLAEAIVLLSAAGAFPALPGVEAGAAMAAFARLLAHLIYGCALGAVAGPPTPATFREAHALPTTPPPVAEQQPPVGTASRAGEAHSGPGRPAA